MPRFLQRLYSSVVYGGTRRMRPYEEAILSYFRKNAPGDAAAVLDEQMEAFHFLKRAHDDRMVNLWFYSAESLPTFEGFPTLDGVDGQAELLRFRISAPDSGSVSGVITAYKGVLRSIEFRKSPTSLGSGTLEPHGFEISQVGKPVFDKPLAQEVDEREHG